MTAGRRVASLDGRGALDLDRGREPEPVRAGGVRPLAIATTVLGSILVVFLAAPIVALIMRAVISGALTEPAWRAVLDALALSLVTTSVSVGITILLGTPLAFILARRRFRGSWLVEAIVDLPIVLPPSVAGLALLFAFGRNGALGGPLATTGLTIPFTTAAVVLAQTFVSAPFYVRAARAGFRGIQRNLESAARIDGASDWTVLRLITVPLAAPALAAGLVMAWARALGEFGATIMFAGNLERSTQTLPLLVYSEFHASLDASVAAAAILVLAALGVLVGVRILGWGRAVVDPSV